MSFAIILDVVVVLLLVPTIIIAVILNNRLSVMRKNREELGRLIAAFNDATVRAESGIPRLKRTSEESSKALQEKVERAQMLRDDLAFMIERGEQMAVRLENVVRDARETPIPERAGAPREGADGRQGPPRVAPLPVGMDIESAAEAAERAAQEAARRAQEAELGLSEWAPGERRPEDRARAERLRAARDDGTQGRGAAQAAQPSARGERPLTRSRQSYGDEGLFDTGVGSPEHALVERILKDQGELSDSRPQERLPAERSQSDRAPAERAPVERAPAERQRAAETRAPRQGDAERRPAERATAAPERSRAADPRTADAADPARQQGAAARQARSGKLLGAALADEPARSVGRAAPAAPRKAGGGASREEDERSEAERELLRALRSVRH